MKIVNLLGGLGNQMFEYAMYLALHIEHPEEEMKVCTRSFKGYSLHNGLEIQKIFGVNLSEASLWELIKLAYPFWNYHSWRVMCHCFPSRSSMIRDGYDLQFDYNRVLRKGSVFYDGYWQNEKYFIQVREMILKAFTFPAFSDVKNLELANVISSCNSVSVHVRRGDYLKHPEVCVCTPLYYKNAIAKINELQNPEMYCVFSDDIDWCKSELAELFNGRHLVFVDWNNANNNYRDMQLMSLCKHNIIANSSFSWWGAWLNNNAGKTVIAPTSFAKYEIKNDPICEDWIRIESE